MKHLQPKSLLLLLAAFLISIGSFGQTAPTAQSLPYSQDFSSLAHSSSTYPAGWQGWNVGTAMSSSFRTNAPTGDRALTGSSSASTTSGGVHNYNGKIGMLGSGSVDPSIALAINTTGHYNVTVSFDAMTIRNPYDGSANTRINGLDLQYNVGGITGTWTSVTGLTDGFYQNNTTTQTGSGVTTPQNLQSFSLTLPAACNNQSAVYLRWVNRDISGAGSRASFAVDNISICPSNPAPSISIALTTGTNPACTGTSLTFTATPTNGGTSPSYQWKLNGGNVGTDSPTYTLASPVNGDVVSCVLTSNASCISSLTANSNTITLSIQSPVTAAPVITSFPATACPGDFTTWTINPVTNATSYDWFGTDPLYVNITGSGTSVTVEHLATSYSGYEINVRGQNLCGTGPASKKWSRRTVSVPGLSGPANACPGETKTYTIPTAITGAVSYTFTAPTGASITDGSSSGNPLTTTALSVNVTFPISFTTGSVCVIAMGPCEATAPRCITVRSTPLTPSPITGSASVCPPVASITYSIPAVPGAVAYQWTLPAGITMINDLGNSAEVSIAGSFVSGNICVAASYGCGFGSSRCLMIKSQKPATPGSMTGPSAGVCNSTQTYTVPLVSGVTYNWTATNSATVTPSGNTANVDFSTATSFPVNVCVTASNACATSAARCLNNIRAVPGTPGTITGASTVFENSVDNPYSITAVFGATSYRWAAPAGCVVDDGSSTGNPLITSSPSVTIDFGVVSGNVSVIAQNACGNSGTRNKYVTVVAPSRLGTDEILPSLSMIPNPANGLAEIQFNADRSGTAMIQIFDMSGRNVFTKTITTEQGVNSLMINLSSIARGSYILAVKQEDAVSRMPVLID